MKSKLLPAALIAIGGFAVADLVRTAIGPWLERAAKGPVAAHRNASADAPVPVGQQAESATQAAALPAPADPYTASTPPADPTPPAAAAAASIAPDARQQPEQAVREQAAKEKFAQDQVLPEQVAKERTTAQASAKPATPPRMGPANLSAAPDALGPATPKPAAAVLKALAERAAAVPGEKPTAVLKTVEN